MGPRFPRTAAPTAVWQFGDDLTFVGLSGEVVSAYVPLCREALGPKNLWIAGYSNEVDGYVPDAKIVAEGGYEARGLVADIGFYSAKTQDVLVESVRQLAQEARRSVRK
jgi:neutral ceramidase